jgi:hypothetical protein
MVILLRHHGDVVPEGSRGSLFPKENREDWRVFNFLKNSIPPLDRGCSSPEPSFLIIRQKNSSGERVL